jgi:hypothetical protein
VELWSGIVVRREPKLVNGESVKIGSRGTGIELELRSGEVELEDPGVGFKSSEFEPGLAGDGG